MRLLLDTHILLWWLAGDPSVPQQAGKEIADARAEVFVSAASAWEIAIKQALGRLRFPVSRIREIVEEAGFVPLGIGIDHAVLAGALPQYHGGPFDRMLVAQAQHEGLTLVSVDPAIRRYDVKILGGGSSGEPAP